ncbi:MAG: HEPN domain-containing protein [Gammaproteobacteria bacterium]
MKRNLDKLPNEKQVELDKVVILIQEMAPVEMIILFGSYARNEGVEEKYDEAHYKYQSDFDILVIVETKSEALQGKLEREIEEKVEKCNEIKTPVSVIVHDIDFINKRLSKAQYFFTDIKKEGVLLYDSGKFQLKEARELLPAERKKLAEEDLNYWFNHAEEFLIDSKNAFGRGSHSKAAFELHQVVERLYSGILLVFTRYKPNTHDLGILRKLTNSVDDRLLRVFPLDNPESKHLFKLLRKAYVDARYKPSYVITDSELSQLYRQVDELKKIGELICHEKINRFA